MRVILSESDILLAIEDFILNTVNLPEDIRVDIDLKATRGPEGYTAEIDLVHYTSPADGSDRSVDDRITVTDEAREEGLGIVAKIDEARAEGKAPRRRGRPPGSKNLPKVEAETETVTEAAPEPEAEPEPEPNSEEALAAEAAVTEPTEEAPVETVEEPVEAEAAAEVQAESEPEVAPVAESSAVEAPAEPEAQPEPAPKAEGKRSLFGEASKTTTDDGPKAEPAAEPAEEEEVDYTPTPETAGLTTADAEGEEAPAPTTTRSLFADLTKPKN